MAMVAPIVTGEYQMYLSTQACARSEAGDASGALALTGQLDEFHKSVVYRKVASDLVMRNLVGEAVQFANSLQAHPLMQSRVYSKIGQTLAEKQEFAIAWKLLNEYGGFTPDDQYAVVLSIVLKLREVSRLTAIVVFLSKIPEPIRARLNHDLFPPTVF